MVAKMETARLSVRSKMVVPKRIREKLRIGPGDVVAFEERGDEVVIKALRRPGNDDPFALFDEWAGEADEEAYAGL